MAEDIVDRLRIAETAPLDADTKVALFLVLQDARAEITRLREETARLRDERRWIPVEEKPPENIQILASVGGFEVWFTPTHWQPLPAPPSEKEAE